MKLQEFFDTQKHTNFTDVDKLDLYQNFLYKKTKKTTIKRSSFVHAKYFIYSMIFVILMIGVYGVYFINNNNLQDYNWFAIRSNITNTAQADYIAQVIDFNGNFFIEHNGVLVQTNNIGNGDTILLKEWAQLVFEINSGTQSKIIGPAKLTIQKTHTDNYKLNLIYGNFIQMEGNERKTQTIELAINDLTVKQEDKSKPLNFKFIKNGSNQIFQNNGANIIVTKSNGEDKTTTISNNQVVAIQSNDIKIFANIDTFTKAVQEKNISQTFSLAEATNSGTVASGTAVKEVTALLSLLNTPQITESNQEITKNISSTLSDEKKILDPSQDEQVNSILYEWFFTPELKDIETSFIAGDGGAFDSAYTKIEKSIQTLYQSFGMTYTKLSGDPTQKLQGLKSAIVSLREKITAEYTIPPKYIESLQTIEKWISNIIVKGYGSSSVQDAPSEQ